MQIRAMLNSALDNCEVSLRDDTVSSAQLDCVLEQAEQAVIKLRLLTEMLRPRSTASSRKPDAPEIANLVGSIEVSNFGWVHLTQNTLPPNCKYKLHSGCKTLCLLLNVC